MSVVMRNSSGFKKVEDDKRVIDLHVRETDVDDALKMISSAPLGSNIAVICNTVNNARRLFAVISEARNVDARLLHSRMFGEHRMMMDRKVLRDFGKSAQRKSESINVVVSTQIIEQSLDLDFDLMFTEICPVENMFQRAGRLHRHEHKDGARPKGFEKPTLWLMNYQSGGDALLMSRGVSYIYHDYLTERLRHHLMALSPDQKIDCTISIPQALKDTLEAVYDPTTLPNELEALASQYATEVESAATAANGFLVSAPLPKRDAPVLGWNDRNIDEDLSGMSVRQGESGPSAALIFDINDELFVPYVDGDGVHEKWKLHPLALSGTIRMQEELRVLGSTLTLQYRTIRDSDIRNQMKEEAQKVLDFWTAPTPNFHSLKTQLAIVLRTKSEDVHPETFLEHEWSSALMGAHTLTYNAEGARW